MLWSIFYVPYYVPVLNGKITTAWHIWNVERERLRYVNNRPEHQRAKEYFSLIEKVSPKHIGLIIGLDTWEYPLWNFLKSNDSLKNVKVEHVKLDSIPSDIDLLYFKANDDLLYFDKNRTKEEIGELNIYKRDSLNYWERIYPIE